MSADDVIPLRCGAYLDDGCECLRELGHPDPHWCVACDYSHEFDVYCDFYDGGCTCSRVPGHDGPHFCSADRGHDFGAGE